MSLSITPTGALNITTVGSLGGLAGAEISAFDPGSNRLFVTSNSGLQIVDLANPAAPTLVTTLNLSLPPYGAISTDASSVAAANGIVAVAVQDTTNKAANGQVVFLDAATNALLGVVTVGAHPDGITFTPDGTRLLVTNEAEYLTDGTPGADGSVTIITISTATGFSTSLQTATFSAFNGQEDALRAQGVRIFAGNTVAADVEPEYIAVSPDGTKAMVTLQEANAVGLLDIATATFTAIVPLGTKDFSTLLADFSDRDGPGNTTMMNLTTGNPVQGLYMPDAIASFASGGDVFYVMANEGDDRDDFLTPDETIRAGNGAYNLDDAAFPNEATLKTNAVLGRLNVSNAPGLRGDTGTDGDVDQILAYGARSFTIRDATGALVFDSGDMIERIVATQFPALFFDDRSDNKGPEPEGITVGEIGGRTFAFVGLERSHMSLVFDITDPQRVTYTGAAQRPGDVAPEGALFISAADSPNGQALYVQSSETSNTLSVFALEQTPAFTLQLLHFADGEAGLLASRTAPNLAALVDAFDGQYANTLILAGGDNYIPGPFLNAGTDPTVQAVHGKGGNFGAADIQIHNLIGVQASTIGNHEFDLGTREFRDAVDDASFPYLSANLVFSADGELASRFQQTVGTGGLETASALAAQQRSIAPSAVVTYGSEVIGLVGATTQIIESISSTGGVEVAGFAGDGAERNDMALLAAQLQPVIDDLRDQGVNKIVLMSHLQQIAFEVELAGLLNGVDIILAAGSNTRLGDADDVAVAFPGHAATFAGTYPLVATGADGNTTLIVNTDNEYTYLGRLVVSFDAAGNIITDSLDAAVNGAYAATDANVAAAWGVAEADLATTAFAAGTKGARVEAITDAVQSVINTKDGTVWGFTEVYLEGERNIVRNQETNLGNITADANMAAARAAIGDGVLIGSLKNGGGIRAQIGAVEVGSGDKTPPTANPDAGKPAGGVSTLDIENSLRFNNTLMVFDTDAAGVKAILEHGVAVLGNQGRFPQLGGLAFSHDPAAPAGSRVISAAAIDAEGRLIARLVEGGAVSAEAPATVSLVTLSFLANGGDSYPIKTVGSNFRFLLTDGTLSAPIDEALDFTAVGNVPANALGEQRAMQDYMAANHATAETAYDQAELAQSADTRIQNRAARGDTVLQGEAIQGLGTPEALEGGVGDDAINGAGGADTLSGLGGRDTLSGGNGDDRLDGGAGNDRADGADGSDSIAGGTGRDRVFGGTGNDLLAGDAGEDQMFGGADADRLSGGADNDRLDGGADADTLDGGEGRDRLFGGTGNDLLDGGNGDDQLFGEAGADTLGGGAGNDRVDGGAEADLLQGGAGVDRLFGGAGADTLEGGADADQLYGGAGADIFLFGAIADSASTAADRIYDFEAGVDRIDLSALDADLATGGDQAFILLGPGAAFTGAAGEIRQVVNAPANLVRIEISLGGDLLPDMVIVSKGITPLASGDFIL
jgi:2',3'-cyclic-nucleotide 2'-phosphodiesterase (5'-nucleotidase family)